MSGRTKLRGTLSFRAGMDAAAPPRFSLLSDGIHAAGIHADGCGGLRYPHWGFGDGFIDRRNGPHVY